MNKPSDRLQAIDAARGVAMLFVLLSHFASVQFAMAADAPLQQSLWRVSMVASPTFVLISGMMMGFLYETRRSSFGPVRDKLVDRALFLLTIGHCQYRRPYPVRRGAGGSAELGVHHRHHRRVHCDREPDRDARRQQTAHRRRCGHLSVESARDPKLASTYLAIRVSQRDLLWPVQRSGPCLCRHIWLMP